MRIVLFANNRVGLEVTRWLAEQNSTIVGVVVHPPEKAKHAPEIIEASGVDQTRVFDGSRLNEPNVIRAIADTQPDVGISVLFDYLFKRPVMDLFPEGLLNLHPGYLPYNRGQYPNVWSIIEGTPAGVTLHYIDEGLDTGDIVAQREVDVRPTDTGESLYRRLEDACVDLFTEAWPNVRTGRASRTLQRLEGTYHRTRDVDRIDEIDLDKSYTGRELIDILRARTFPPHRGAFFILNGRKIYLSLHLEDADDQEGA